MVRSSSSKKVTKHKVSAKYTMNSKLKSLNKKYGTKHIFLKKSKFPNAGIGAFTAVPLPEGKRLGEYKGRILSEQKAYAPGRSELLLCYLFELKRRSEPNVFIDAYPLKTSNWTRFVNSIKDTNERNTENVRYYQYGQKIWLETTRDVEEGEELVCDYGSDYWTDDEEEDEEEEE